MLPAVKAVNPAGTYAALLRGINVGRAKRVPMADLRQVYTDAGFTAVRTLLNSGNVVFAGPSPLPADAAAVLEEALVRRTGVRSAVVLLSAAELDTAVTANPLTERATDPSRLLLAVYDGRPPGLADLLAQDWAPEALALGERAAYLWCPAGVLQSPLASALGKLGGSVTTRNWATIRKLHAATRG